MTIEEIQEFIEECAEVEEENQELKNDIISITDMEGTLHKFKNPYWDYIKLTNCTYFDNDIIIQGIARDDLGSIVGLAWDIDGYNLGQGKDWDLKKLDNYIDIEKANELTDFFNTKGEI